MTYYLISDQSFLGHMLIPNLIIESDDQIRNETEVLFDRVIRTTCIGQQQIPTAHKDGVNKNINFLLK